MDVKCPHCGQEYTIDESMIGVDLHCQTCNGIMRFELPEAPPLVPVPPVEAPPEVALGYEETPVMPEFVAEEAYEVPVEDPNEGYVAPAGFAGIPGYESAETAEPQYYEEQANEEAVVGGFAG